MFTTPECIKTPVDLVKLWLHEASRVYGDKLIETKDMDTFQKMKLDIAKAGFEVSLLFKRAATNCLCALIAVSLVGEPYDIYHTLITWGLL